ncbi:MAG TPA: glycogen debranching N-terminal domain-containing protein [Candidatus Limnocylindrales bacterium]|nr:glycogen debranching N-terminal domain-containing protein [Candidatus Limnocylindrales bacterium]
MPRLAGAGGGGASPQASTSSALVLHAGYTVLCAGPDGSIDGGADGLYDYDTRILSRFRLTVDGRRPELVSAAKPEADMLVARFRVPRPGGRPEGPLLPEDAVELVLERRLGAGMVDRWTFHNHSAVAWDGRLRLEVDADFADVAEVGAERRQNGEVSSRQGPRSVELRYDARRGNRRFQRAVRVRALPVRAGGKAADGGSSEAPGSDATHLDIDAGDTGMTMRARLGPRAALRLEVRVSSRVEGRWRAPDSPEQELDVATRARQRAAWRGARVRVEGHGRLSAPFARAQDDLFALRNQDLETDLLVSPAGARQPGWIVNAGVPTFTGFFGRDTLTAGWQSALTGTSTLRGALEVAASHQATEDDPWRDAEPGKMLHELRRGPLAMLGVNPRDAYYGSQTTPAMFVVVLSELWHWTGDDRVLRRFRDAAVRAIDWADGTMNERGFVTYLRRSPAGLANQGWKDSDEAIRHANGRVAEAPLATVEEQAFHFLALQRLAEIMVVLGDDGAADALLDRAAALKRRWHQAFWMPHESYYALALDADGGQVASITSNPGHALASGIVPAERARAVADRLLSSDLFSGWGVRTLAQDHPSYNPLGYHLGAVWPVENATFALGLKRYGLDDHLERLGSAILEAAAASPEGRLPEAVTGHRRAPGVGPAPYPNACSPQAWSASAVIQTLQLLLGLYPFAPLHLLAVVRPRLPQWLPEVTLRNVRIGAATVDLAFKRDADGSASHKVLRTDGNLSVVRAGPPEDAGGTPSSWLEQLEREALRHAPGRLVRAARIAVGLEEG